jgi:hypothetical protein
MESGFRRSKSPTKFDHATSWNTDWAEPDASKIEVDLSIGTRWREPIENEAKSKVGDEFKFGLAKFARYVIHLLFLHYLSCDQPGGVHKTTLRGGTQSHMEKFGTKLIEGKNV